MEVEERGEGDVPNVRRRRHRYRFLVKFDHDQNFHDDAGRNDPTLITKLGAFWIVKKLREKMEKGEEQKEKERGRSREREGEESRGSRRRK